MEEKKQSEMASSNKDYPASRKVLGVSVLLVIVTLLSTFSYLFLIFSAVLFAWVLSASQRPALSVAVPLVSTALLWIFSNDLPLSLIGGISPFVMGFFAAIAIKKKLSFWNGSALCAIGVGVYSVSSFVYMISEWSVDKGCENLFEAASLWWQEVTSSAAQIFMKTLEGADLGIELTTDTISQLVSGTTVLLPGSLSAIFIFIGSLTYLLCAVAHRALGTVEKHFSKKFDPTVGLHTAIFFVVTVLMAVLSSGFKNAEVVQFAFINIAIAMFFPLFITGLAILIFKIKMSRRVVAIQAPDGSMIPRRKGTFILWIIIPLVIFNPFMGFTFIAFYGAAERINADLFRYMKKRMDEKN